MTAPCHVAGGAYLPRFAGDLYPVAPDCALRVKAEPLTRKNTPDYIWPISFDPVADIEGGALELFDVGADGFLRMCERIDGALFQRALLDIVRAAHPGVRWTLYAVPSQGHARALYGIANGVCVAAIAGITTGEDIL